MSLESDLREYLLSLADVASLLAQRIYFDEIPERIGLNETLLLVQLDSEELDDYLDGAAQDLHFPAYRFEARAWRKEQAIALGDVVRRALSNDAVSLGIAGTSIESITVSRQFDDTVEIVVEEGQSVVLKTRVVIATIGVRHDVSPVI